MNSFHIKDLMSRTGVIFGTSGLRGMVADMSDEVCYAFTIAFLQNVVNETDKVVVGHDLRPSSPQIAAACAAAIHETGRQIVFAGALPTPALAFYAAQLGAPAIVVTGSHIPFNRNGIKFYSAKGEISKLDEQAMQAARISLPNVINPVFMSPPNELASNSYLRRYLDFFGCDALTGFRVAIYEHSSVGRDVIRIILQSMGAEVISLGRTSTFVPIDTEAVRSEDVDQAKQWAQENSFDVILSTDGDADRPLIGDENGQWLRGDVVGILCAQYLQAQVVVTPVSSNTAVELCGSFAQVERTKIGSPYVIAAMELAISQGDQVTVGYEANGGFLLGSDIERNGRRLAALPTRDAVLPMLTLLCMARELGQKISQLSKRLPSRYTASDRLQNFPTNKSQELISSLLSKPELLVATLAPKAGSVNSIDQTDGLRVMFASSDIVHLRASGNAPELRCYAEADTPERAKLLCECCLQRVLAYN